MKDFCAAVNNSKGRSIEIDVLRYLIPNDQKRFEIKYSLVDTSFDKRITPKKAPFIVFSKIPSQKIYRGVFTTSNLENALYTKTDLQKYKLIIGTKYDLPKQSLIEHKFFKVVPIKNILQDYGMLSEEDTLKLIKYTCLSHSVSININKNINIVDVGDVVSLADKNYFIYKVNQNKIEGINIKKVSHNCYRQNIDYFYYYGESYLINYNDKLVLSDDDKLLLIDSFPSNAVEILKEKKYKKERGLR